MQSEEAKILLGFAPHSRPSPSQIKAAFRNKVWECHPDRFPAHGKSSAETKFKLVSEAYTVLNSGACGQGLRAGPYNTRVVRTGVPRTNGGRRNIALASVPFLFIVASAFTLGGSTASRAYRRQKEAHPSFNPFLP